MKNFNILVVREKIQVLGGSQIPIYRGIAWKGGLGQFADWRQELGKKEGGGLYPNPHYDSYLLPAETV